LKTNQQPRFQCFSEDRSEDLFEDHRNAEDGRLPAGFRVAIGLFGSGGGRSPLKPAVSVLTASKPATWIQSPWTVRWHCTRPVGLHPGLFGHRALDQKTDWLARCLHCGHIRTMSKTATIRTRIEPVLKSEVEAILAQLGLTASEAVHLLYRQIQLQRGLPFEVRLPNKLTTTVLNASKAGRNVKRFGTKKELYSDLGI
jgi:DNA-damage-inducible protein J